MREFSLKNVKKDKFYFKMQVILIKGRKLFFLDGQIFLKKFDFPAF